MKSKSSAPEFLAVLLGLLLVPAAGSGMADGLSVLVSPPRFELAGNPGDVLRSHVEITNPNNRPIQLELRTADWDMTETGAVTIHPPELQPDSCRPWARIERHKLRLRSLGSKRYRFQIDIPADAAAGECRLALLLQPPAEEAVITRADTLSIPVQARIAVVMYVRIGGASPELALQDIVLEAGDGQPVPVAIVHNGGNAHARTAGFVEGRDADGQRLEFAVAALPILPGQTRRIPLRRAYPAGSEPQPFAAPLELKGTLEWETGSAQIEARLGQPAVTD